MKEEKWIGSYSFTQNAYDIDKIDSLCESNVSLYRKGLMGFVPICCGSSHEEVRSLLDAYRAEKEKMFKQFEDMMVECIGKLAEEGSEVRIENRNSEAEQTVGDPFINDVIVFVPAGRKDHGMYPLIPIDRYYASFFANTGGWKSMDEAAWGIANEILADFHEVWENAPDHCPCCEEEQE